MGFKAFKKHFGIDGHIVSIRDGAILIGSEYVSNLVGFDMQTGKVLVSDAFSSFLGKFYPNILNSSNEERLALIKIEDHFHRSIPVYTYSDGKIIEKHCEELGFPNVTHDGELMYSNTHFANKKDAIEKACENLSHQIHHQEESIVELESKIVQKKEKIAKCRKILGELSSLS